MAEPRVNDEEVRRLCSDGELVRYFSSDMLQRLAHDLRDARAALAAIRTELADGRHCHHGDCGYMCPQHRVVHLHRPTPYDPARALATAVPLCPDCDTPMTFACIQRRREEREERDHLWRERDALRTLLRNILNHTTPLCLHERHDREWHADHAEHAALAARVAEALKETP